VGQVEETKAQQMDNQAAVSSLVDKEDDRQSEDMKEQNQII
jgi:hypothetical protein